PRGPRYTFSSHLRIEHDFGAFTSGRVALPGRSHDALDLVPELETTSLQLDVLYAYASAEGLVGGRLDLQLGRQLVFDSLDVLAFDGARAVVRGRAPVEVEAFAGLRLREASPLGGPWFEPDGTSGGECA